MYPQPAILRMEMAFIFDFDQLYQFYRNSDILELNEHEVVTENISIFFPQSLPFGSCTSNKLPGKGIQSQFIQGYLSILNW